MFCFQFFKILNNKDSEYFTKKCLPLNEVKKQILSILYIDFYKIP